MMDFLQNNWGDLFGALGFVASALGLAAAAWAALNARSAKQAAIEARDRIGRTLTVADVQRAISLIERVKERHAENRWDAAADRYPDLRELLYNVRARLPDEYGDMRRDLLRAATQSLELENEAVGGAPSTENTIKTIRSLNEMQDLLQRITSGLLWEGRRGEDD